MKVYIAGPMRGYEEYNHPAFHAAEAAWAARGWDVVNPARLDEYLGIPLDEIVATHSFEDFMARDLAMLVYCDAIALLRGWQDSRGAQVEHAVATTMGKRVFDASYPAPLPVTDHEFREGSWSAGVTNQCCNKPDYMHLPLWRQGAI